jgi:hypothetical protein
VRRAVMLVVLLGLVAGSACASKSNGAPTATTNSVVRPHSTAKLTILEPKAGAEPTTRTVVVKLRLDGGTITKVVTTDIKPNVGHVHIRLDGRTITLLGSLTNPVPVTPGPHIVEAEFVAADHGPFNPRVLSAVSFTVK